MPAGVLYPLRRPGVWLVTLNWLSGRFLFILPSISVWNVQPFAIWLISTRFQKRKNPLPIPGGWWQRTERLEVPPLSLSDCPSSTVVDYLWITTANCPH